MRFLLAMVIAATATACATVVSQATNGFAANLGTAIVNQDDPETVRDGAPAFLLMLDGFVEGAPDDVATLTAASELYAAYGVLFVDERERAVRLTTRALDYAARALCAGNDSACGIRELRFVDYVARLGDLRTRDVGTLYSFSLAWFAWIRANEGDMGALSKLPRAEEALRRVKQLDDGYRAADVERYLGVVSTIRPPALGGRFDEGRGHFERAIELSGGRDLAAKVDYARYYARTLYERDLHDRLLGEVLEAEPREPGLTLFNVLAQEQAQELLETADDYF